jgi:putative glutamine amidotransferase
MTHARPLIAITCDRRAEGPTRPPPGKTRLAKPEVFVNEAVVSRVRAAGGVAVLLPPGDVDAAEALLRVVHGVIVTGGAFDIHPARYGRAVSARLDRTDEARTDLELRLCALAVADDIPLLGLCGGMQALVVALGGTLLQHVEGHEQANDPSQAGHPMLPNPVAPPLLAALVGPDTNSTHHQAVENLGPLHPLAHAPDGVVEAVWLPGATFAVGVQGHPELRDDRLFVALVEAARGRCGRPGRGP